MSIPDANHKPEAPLNDEDPYVNDDIENEMLALDGGYSFLSPICNRCAHYTHLNGPLSCDAYPGPVNRWFIKNAAIPLYIWRGNHDHKTHYPGDHGIMFEPRPRWLKASA